MINNLLLSIMEHENLKNNYTKRPFKVRARLAFFSYFKKLSVHYLGCPTPGILRIIRAFHMMNIRLVT